MSNHSSSGRESVDSDSLQLSNVESLILAQAVWELGGSAWQPIAKLLSKHPLLSRPKGFFTPQSCYSMYIRLVKEADIPYDTDSAKAMHSIESLKLAQKFYQKRLDELKCLIVAEETKFKAILDEIEAIRDGRWNERMDPPMDPRLKGESPKAAPTDVFDGSELSGVTDSPPSSESQDVAIESTRKSQEREQEEESIIGEQLASPSARSPPTENLPNSQMDMDVHIVTEECLQPLQSEEKIIDAEEQAALPTTEEGPATPAASSDHQVIDECKEARHQDEEEAEAEQQEELEPEQELELELEQERGEGQDQEAGAQPLLGPPVSPARLEFSEDVDQVEDEGDQASQESPRVEQVKEEDEVIMTSDEPQPVMRRSRRQRSSISTIPPILRKSTGVRRSRRVSEATETDRTTDGEVEVQPEVDVVMEESDRNQPPSPANDESSPLDVEGKRNASLLESVDSPRDKKRLRDDSEPVEDDEPEPSPAAIRRRRRGDKTEEQVALKRFQNVIGMLHAQISQHRNGNIFHNPIKTSDAPDYHEIVKRPIDLKTIKAKVKDGHIANSLEYQRDIYLMFANAMMYNVPGSDVFAMAEDMMLESEAHISSFRQTEGLVRRL